ncbi:hypothetical protein Dimus_029075 [Dionaea muscipula]
MYVTRDVVFHEHIVFHARPSLQGKSVSEGQNWTWKRLDVEFLTVLILRQACVGGSSGDGVNDGVSLNDGLNNGVSVSSGDEVPPGSEGDEMPPGGEGQHRSGGHGNDVEVSTCENNGMMEHGSVEDGIQEVDILFLGEEPDETCLLVPPSSTRWPQHPFLREFSAHDSTSSLLFLMRGLIVELTAFRSFYNECRLGKQNEMT